MHICLSVVFLCEVITVSEMVVKLIFTDNMKNIYVVLENVSLSPSIWSYNRLVPCLGEFNF